MVAFSGSDPIGVLIGAKRPSGTLVQKIAVHPDHRRQGHGRHLLTSLSSKLAILGPPRMVAEVPETLAPACELFVASGYVQEAVLTDYALEGPALSESGNDARVEAFVIPVTVDDLAANGLLGEAPPSPSASAGQVQRVCWERSVETLTARKDDIAGLAVATDEQIEAYLLYVKPEVGPEWNAETGLHASPPPADIVSLRTFIDDGGARLQQLLSRLRAQGIEDLPIPEGPPGGDLKGVPRDARFPPRRRAFTLRSEGAVQLKVPKCQVPRCQSASAKVPPRLSVSSFARLPAGP